VGLIMRFEELHMSFTDNMHLQLANPTLAMDTLYQIFSHIRLWRELRRQGRTTKAKLNQYLTLKVK